MKMVSLLKSVKKQPYLNMFKKKQSNKGVIWASLISIGVSILMMMLSKGRREKVTSSLQNITKGFSAKNALSMMNNMGLTEFSEEFHTNKSHDKGNTKKANIAGGSMEFSEEFHTNKSHDKENAKKVNNAGGLNEFSDEIFSNLPAKGEVSNMDDAALAEFSEEIMSKALQDK